MSAAEAGKTYYRYCGRDFTIAEMALIRHHIAAAPPLNRAQLSRAVCDDLRWLRSDGRRKDMSCRVAMPRMERDGLIRLPPPLNTNSNGRIKPPNTSAGDPGQPIHASLTALGKLLPCPVRSRQDSALCNELIDRYIGAHIYPDN